MGFLRFSAEAWESAGPPGAFGASVPEGFMLDCFPEGEGWVSEGDRILVVRSPELPCGVACPNHNSNGIISTLFN